MTTGIIRPPEAAIDRLGRGRPEYVSNAKVEGEGETVFVPVRAVRPGSRKKVTSSGSGAL
jgi:hypothetical protein